MTSTLTDWARAWAVPDAALDDLRVRLGALDFNRTPLTTGTSEAAVQAQVRIEASRRGLRLWRNNVGVHHDPESGVYVRYGLANDTPAVNARVKSADLIGIRPRVIGPADVGTLIGQFVSRECKHAGWAYTGSERERAQYAWAALVTSLGGDAGFCTGPGSL